MRRIRLLLPLCLCPLLLSCGREPDIAKEVRSAYALAEQWLLSNVKDKGTFRYLYNPVTGEEADKNNPIRQLMAAKILADLARERPELLELHRKNLNFYLTYWYKEKDGLGYVFFNGSSKLGSNGVLLSTLVKSPDFQEHAEKAKALAEGILSIMDKDGGMHAWFVPPEDPGDEAYQQYLLTFYSGEALLGLAEYYERTQDPRILEALQRSQHYYIDRYVTQMDQHYYPAYVPWQTQSLFHLWNITGDSRYAAAIFALNDKVLELLDRTDEVGRFFNPATPQYGTPHSSSDGVYTEGLAYALDTAIRSGDAAREKRYREALHLALRNLISLQYTAEEAASFEHPTWVRGALRTKRGSDYIRIDTTQHTMDAFRKVLPLL